MVTEIRRIESNQNESAKKSLCDKIFESENSQVSSREQIDILDKTIENSPETAVMRDRKNKKEQISPKKNVEFDKDGNLILKPLRPSVRKDLNIKINGNTSAMQYGNSIHDKNILARHLAMQSEFNR